MVEGAIPPPPGVVPDFGNPDKTVYYANIITQVLCLPVAGVLIGVRIYAKTRILARFGKDDWLCILGWILATGYSAIALTMSHFGGGINEWEVPKSEIQPFGKTVYATMVLYGPCVFFIKTSILLFLCRTFEPYQKFVRGIYMFIGFMLAYYLPVVMLKGFICRPVQKFWSANTEGQCFNQRALILADVCISVLSDLIIFTLPLPLVTNLQMPLKTKLRVAAVFSAGGLACVASIIRLVDIVRNGTDPNQTLVFMRVNLWGIAEVYLGLICACMPALSAAYKHHFGKKHRGAGYAGYVGYGSADQSIQMKSRMGEREMTKTLPDYMSDESVLITENKVQSSALGTSWHVYSEGAERQPNNSSGTTSMDDRQMITKTVEVHQTLD